MINNLSPKRDFTPSNPHLEEEIKVFLKTPVRFDKPSLPKTQNKNYYGETRGSFVIRKSAPSLPYSQRSTSRVNHSSPSWNPPEIDDDTGHSAGVRRAFDQKHKKYSEVALRQNEQIWEDEEKYRRWKLRKAYQTSDTKPRNHDHHVIENVIQSRNDYYVSSMNNFRPTIKFKTSKCRPAPVEIRSVGKNRTYYWA